MSRIAWLVCACGLALVAAPAFADDPKPDDKKAAPKPAPRADAAEKILDVLAAELELPKDQNPSETPLFETLQYLGKRYNANFVINEAAFKAAGRPNIREEKPTVTASALGGVTVHQFLTLALDSLGATYLVKNGTIEVVDVGHAAKVTKSGVSQDEDGLPRLNERLVSAVAKEKPFNEVVAKIAEQYDLTVTIAPQAGDAKTGFVTARLLNVPADKALELLALQCDLRVVRRGAAFLVTSRDHANELFAEKLDRERQQIEIQKLREAPAKPPAPEKPPAPPEK